MITLYVKYIPQTGLKYFGKTNRNPHKYRGSGKYWLTHIKKHKIKPKDIVTFIIKQFEHEGDELVNYALRFSKLNNIVSSEKWANLILENGIDGGVVLWSDEDLRLEALKYKTRGEFFKNSCSAYITARTRGILQDIMEHMGNKELTIDSAREELSNYKTLKDLRKNKKLYSYCIRNELICILPKIKTEKKIRDNKEIKKEEIIEVINQCTSLKEFRVNYKSMYDKCSKMGWLKELTAPLKKYSSVVKWDEEKIKYEALKYKHQKDFITNSPGAVAAARKMGIFKEVCTHMVYKVPENRKNNKFGRD